MSRQAFTVIVESDGRFLYTAGRRLEIWDSSSGALMASFAAHYFEVTALEMSKDGGTLLTAGNDRDGNRVKVWKVHAP